MRYCGVDLSTRAIDLAFLDTDQNVAEWVRITLDGATAWDRILTIRDKMPPQSTWDDVCLVAVEKPIPDQRGLLGNVLGALSASLPKKLRQSHTFWTVTPSVWKKELGIHAHKKPSWEQVAALLPGLVVSGEVVALDAVDAQDQWDALCIAAWARKTNEGT